VFLVARDLVDSLVTTAPTKSREEAAAKARSRAMSRAYQPAGA
jgi:hypothetical protein